MTQHTPTPWAVDNTSPHRGPAIYQDDHDHEAVICEMYNSDFVTPPEQKANAAHIVKCVNLHDELVRACKLVAENAPLVVRWLEENDPTAIKQVREVLAKAEQP